MSKQLNNNKLCIVKMVFLFIICVLSCPMIAMAESVDEVALRIHSPENIEAFYRRGFQEVLKIPDVLQTPQETLDLKSGDCDDFARLSQAILKRLGVESEVVIIKFDKLKIMHAICVWKGAKYYNYFDVRKLVKTKETSIQGVTDHYAFDLECCTACKLKLDVSKGVCKLPSTH